jgi:tape measure domain-containing protein
VSNNVDFQINMDMSAFSNAMQSVQSGIANIQTDLNRLQQAERFTYFSENTRRFVYELSNANRVVAEQRELLKQLENYEKFLKDARSKTNDTASIDKYNAELARTRAAMVELRTVGGEALASLRLTTDNVAGSAKKANEGYSSLTKTVIGLASAYLSLSTFTDFTKSAILAANNYEQLNIAFTTILKSKAQADELQAKIVELAAKTPYELPQLQETTKKLLAYGFAAKDIIPTLTGIGDIAAGVGLEKLPQITNALGKMHAANRMMLGDVNSLTKAGINILAELETATGKSGAALRKYISQGNVTYDTAYAALMRIAKTDFGGLMEKQSQTVSGLFSTLKDNATQASKSIGDGINEKLKDVIRYWTEFLGRTSQDDLKKWGDRIGAVVVVISMLIANILQLLPSLTAMMVIIKLYQEWQNFDTAVKKWNETATGATGRIAFLKDGFSKLWTTITANPIGLMITAFAMLLPVAQLVYEKLTALSDREKDLNQNIKDVVNATSIQINESSKLFAIVRDGTSTKEQHAGAVKKLLELSKEHGTGIETEAQLLGNLTNAEKLLTTAIIETAIARQKAMIIQKATDEVIQNQIKIAELERKGLEKGGERQIYNAETGVTETYNPNGDAVEQLRAKNDEIAKRSAQSVSDIGNSTKEMTKVLTSAMKVPFSELNTQISTTSKQLEVTTAKYEAKRIEIETSAKSATKEQQKAMQSDLKALETEKNRLANSIRLQKAELNRDKDAIAGVGGKKTIETEKIDPKAEKNAEKRAKDAENDAKRRENEAWSAKQKLLDLDIRAESDAATKQKLQAKKGYDEYLHELEKFHKDKAFSDSKYNEYKKSALDDYNKQIANIEITAIEKSENEAISREKRGAKLIADNRLKELKVHEIAFNEAKLKANRELKDNQTELATELLGLEKDFSAKRFEINQSYDKKDFENKFKVEKEKIDLLKSNFDLMEIETRAAFEKSNPNKRQRENFEKLEARNKQLFQLEVHKAELKLEKEQQISLAKIGIDGSGARVELLDKQIKSVNAQIETVKITPIQNGEGKKFDLWRDVFGLDSENDKDAQRIKAIKKAGDELSKLANQYLATQLKNAEKELKLHDDAVKKAEDRVKKEKELQDKGLANDLETAEKALSKEKELQAQALAEKQKVQKQQLVLESIGQFSSLVSASANIFETMSAIPYIGIPLAIATIATMFGSFAMAKADAWDSISKYRDGNKVQKIQSGLLKGRSHDEGGILIEAEGDEWIVNKKQSKEFDPELNAINSGNEAKLKELVFKRFAYIEPSPKFQGAKVVQIFEAKNNEQIATQKANEAKNSELIELQKEANLLLKKILSEMPPETTDLGDFVQKRKGNRIETIKKFKKTS